MIRWILLAVLLLAHPVISSASAGEALTTLLALPERVDEDRIEKPLPELAGARIGTYQVQFNPGKLIMTEGIRGWPSGLDQGAPQGEVHLPGALRVQLPEQSRMIQLEIREVHQVSPGVVSYVGHIDDEPAYAATITVNLATDHVLARFHHGSKLYLIDQKIENRQAQVHVIDQRHIPVFDCVAESEEIAFIERAESDFNLGDPTVSSSQGNGNVRAVFYYTPEVASNNDINVMIDTIVTEMNSTAYSSGVDPKNYISAADRIQTDVDFNSSGYCGCCSIHQPLQNDLLGKMSNSDGEFAQISSQMGAVQADFAVLLVSNACGRVGGAILGSHDMEHPVPFVVVTDEFALSDLTALHEIGHVLGSGHEQTASSTPDPIPNAPYNARGHLEPSPPPSGAQWQTMMGGYQTPGEPHKCSFDHNEDPDNQSCVRLPVWSNPHNIYDGKPTGVVNVAFNVQALDTTMPLAADWGLSYPYAVPSVPTLTATSGYCYGLNGVSWSAPANSEIYQLFVDKPFPAGWTRSHHGTGHNMSLNVPQSDGSWNLRVRACNGSGCSGFSSTVSVHYFPGCM